jgi:DNA-binding LytR/AlgR family response regulator
MNVLIIEDEILAAERLAELLVKYDTTIQVLDILDSVEDTVEWLLTNPLPDLILMDIHLSDGLSFNIFNQVPVHSPIIFTTAFDQYAIQAFKVNSIDYLLKPVSFVNLAQSMQKWKTLASGHYLWGTTNLQKVAETLLKQNRNYKTRFLVRYGDHILFKNTNEVASFYADGKIAYLITNEGKRFIIEYTLEELEDLLDPDLFFRLNRKVIAQLHSIKHIRAYLHGRLKVALQPGLDFDVIVSRERVTDFKAWLDK